MSREDAASRAQCHAPATDEKNVESTIGLHSTVLTSPLSWVADAAVLSASNPGKDACSYSSYSKSESESKSQPQSKREALAIARDEEPRPEASEGWAAAVSPAAAAAVPLPGESTEPSA